MEVILFLIIASVVLLFVSIAYLIGGFILSLVLNPVLLNFGLNTITPYIGALILVLINWIYYIIRKKD